MLICLAIIAPAVFTGFFLAMGILARQDRKELEAMHRRLEELEHDLLKAAKTSR